MKHTKLLVVALLVALMACLAMTAMADTIYWEEQTAQYQAPTCWKKGVRVFYGYASPKTGDDTKDAARSIIDTRYDFIDELPHHWVFGTTEDKKATCTAPGEIYAHCDNEFDGVKCVHIDTTQVMYTKKAAHDWETISAGIPAKCTVDGYEPIKKCKNCGAFQDSDNDGSLIPALGHDWVGTTGSNWTTDREATCGKTGLAYRTCKRTGCTAKDWLETPKADFHCKLDGGKRVALAAADWILVTPEKPATCTENGCKKIEQCPTCGAQRGGETVAASGHNYNVTWTVLKEATCAEEGKAVRRCDNKDIYGKVCGAVLESVTQPKTSTHQYYDTKAKKYVGTNLSDKGVSDWPKTIDKYTEDPIWAFITPAKDATCTQAACLPVYRCKVCGAVVGGVTSGSALGHDWQKVKEDKATCIDDGKIVNQCSRCGISETIKIPAYGHYATWMPQAGSDASKGYVIWELKCANAKCPVGVLATQVVKNGDKAPSGVVTTGKVAVDAAYTNNTKGTTDIALNGKTSTTTATTTTKTSTKSTAKSTASTASTKTAAAAPAAAAAAPAAKKVATVAAVKAAPAAELEPNQAQLVADKHLYVVKNVAGEEIVLTVNIVDGKITVEANLAEGESLVLYANAEAIENPTAENTLVLTANEAVELPEAFQNAIVAVVKTESLPTALAAK